MKYTTKLISILALWAICFNASASEVTITKPYFRWLFGGFGFQHAEANFEALMSDEFRDQRVLKTFAEIYPSFARVYSACALSSKDQLDRFAEYYHKTFAKAGTTLYVVPAPLPFRVEDPDVIDARKYASIVGENLEYLIKEKGCKSIAYFCLTNELMTGQRWGWFNGKGEDFEKRMNIYKEWTIACYDEFIRRGLNIRQIGSDVATGSPEPYSMLKAQEWTRKNMDDWLDAYVSHWYAYDRPIENMDLWHICYDYFGTEVQNALSKDKHYILGEFGYNISGKKGVMIDDANHAIRDPKNAGEGVLCKCEMALAAINVGTYGVVSWSFVDYPDPFCYEEGEGEESHLRHEAGICAYHPDMKYNKAGMFHWGDIDHNYSAKPDLYALGYLAKLFKKNATVLCCESTDTLVRTSAVLNPDRSVTIALINRRAQQQDITVDCSSWAQHNGIDFLEKEARVYVYEAENPPYNEFNDLQPFSTKVKAESGKIFVKLPAKSVVFVTTDYTDRIPSKITGIKVKGNTLEWKECNDKQHRYYRVFKDGKQIASTVATTLELSSTSGNYSVVSVDAWGNQGEK